MTERIAPKRWSHQHPKLTLSAFALLGCVVVIIMAESAIRVFLPQWAPKREERVKFWSYSEILGWEHLPNQRGRFNHQDFSVDVVINSQGIRDDEYSLNRTDKKRMLVLGDSFGWGFGVEHQDRFSEILEDIHSDWEIINASVSGYGTDQQFLFLKEKAIAFRPDVVLLLFHNSDFGNNIHAVDNWYYKPFFVVERGHLKLQNVPVPKSTTIQRFARFLMGRTYLGLRVCYCLKRLKTRVVSLTRSMRPASREKNSMDEQRTYLVTYHLIKAMSKLSKEEGAKFVLVSIPMNVEEREWIQKITKKENIPYLQLDKYFESMEGSTRFPHDYHWNVKGHAIAAKAIDDFLRILNVFD